MAARVGAFLRSAAEVGSSMWGQIEVAAKNFKLPTDTPSNVINLRNQYLNARINSIPERWAQAKAEAAETVRVLRTGDATVAQAAKGVRVAAEAFVLFSVGELVGRVFSSKPAEKEHK